MNCPTNTHLMDKYHFKGQLIIPCVNDGGQSIGIGLHYFYQIIMDSVLPFNLHFMEIAALIIRRSSGVLSRTCIQVLNSSAQILKKNL